MYLFCLTPIVSLACKSDENARVRTIKATNKASNKPSVNVAYSFRYAVVTIMIRLRFDFGSTAIRPSYHHSTTVGLRYGMIC